MPNQNEVRRQITARIIEALEHEQIPWRRPWIALTNTGRPSNVVSKKPYQGVKASAPDKPCLSAVLSKDIARLFERVADAGAARQDRA